MDISGQSSEFVNYLQMDDKKKATKAEKKAIEVLQKYNLLSYDITKKGDLELEDKDIYDNSDDQVRRYYFGSNSASV